jgi:hypothetical protein
MNIGPYAILQFYGGGDDIFVGILGVLISSGNVLGVLIS